MPLPSYPYPHSAPTLDVPPPQIGQLGLQLQQLNQQRPVEEAQAAHINAQTQQLEQVRQDRQAIAQKFGMPVEAVDAALKTLDSIKDDEVKVQFANRIFHLDLKYDKNSKKIVHALGNGQFATYDPTSETAKTVGEANPPPAKSLSTESQYFVEGTPEQQARAAELIKLQHPERTPSLADQTDADILKAYADKHNLTDLTAGQRQAAREENKRLMEKPKDQELADLQKILLRMNIEQKKSGVVADEDARKMASAIVAGRMAPSQLSALGRSQARANIMSEVYRMDPEFDVMASEAGVVAGNRNQKMIRSLDAVNTGLDTVLKYSKEFPRSDVGVINDVILKGETQLNDPRAIRFQSAVQGVIDDLASALSGGGATTDQARNQARSIFSTSYSKNGLDAAVTSIRDIIAKRRSAFAAGTVYEKGNRLNQPVELPGGTAAADRTTNPQRIVQKSKSTGQYRHSDDGGATWQPGQ